MYGSPVANPGKLTTKVMYPAYYYSTSASTSEAFKTTPTIPRQSTPIMKPCNVYTPPGYDKQTQYPLIVIMHGITDNENTWNERSRPNVATLFDNLIGSKATKPFVAVFALGTVQNSTNGYYAFGAELMNDLLPFIEANYSVKKERGSRELISVRLLPRLADRSSCRTDREGRELDAPRVDQPVAARGFSADQPTFITEWGYASSDPSSFGPSLQMIANSDGASWTAWVTDNGWTPSMFADANLSTLTNFGTLVKSWLAATASNDCVQ
jgi:hypothetical protein